MNHRRVDLERGRPSIMNSNIIHAPAWKQNTTRSNTPHWCVQKRDIRRVAVKGGGLPRQQIAPGSWTIPTTMSHPSCTTRACCCTTLLGIISHSFHSFHRLYSRKVFLRFAPAPRVQHHNPASQIQHRNSSTTSPPPFFLRRFIYFPPNSQPSYTHVKQQWTPNLTKNILPKCKTSPPPKCCPGMLDGHCIIIFTPPLGLRCNIIVNV